MVLDVQSLFSGRRRSIAALLVLGISLIAGVHAQEVIQTEHGDVFVTTLAEYLDEGRGTCGELPRGIKSKAWQLQDGHNFTEEEYRRLAGDAPLPGLRGYGWWYSRDERRHVDWGAVLPSDFGNDEAYTGLPILCGVPRPEAPVVDANPVVAWNEGRPGCEGAFCGLAGGAYLQAVYENDVALVKRFDASVDRTVRQRLGAVLSLAESLGERPQSFSLLPAVANAYLAAYTAHRDPSCGDEVTSRVVTHKNPTYDIWDRQGIYDGQAGGEEYRHTYLVKPSLDALCDRVCDHLGGRGEASALRSLGHAGAVATLAGVGELVEGHTCSSAEVDQFERNLASLTEAYWARRYDWFSE